MAERVDVGAIRRAQIVEAAMRVIARKGFHNATLAEVEGEAGISRGMMTYHYPTKDAMIQGVFEATIDRLRASIEPTGGESRGLQRIDRAIDGAVFQARSDCEFFCLVHTFLAQAVHRPDYRFHFAAIYTSMRQAFCRDLRDAGHSELAAISLATILVAALQGLAVQTQSDPQDFDPSAFAKALKALARPSLSLD